MFSGCLTPSGLFTNRIRENIKNRYHLAIHMQEEKLPFVSFAVRLQQAMDEKRWTSSELSRKTKLSKPTIYRYLKDERRPGCDELYILAKMLGVSMNWLMGDDEDQETVAKWKHRAEEAEARLSAFRSGMKTLSKTVSSLSNLLTD